MLNNVYITKYRPLEIIVEFETETLVIGVGAHLTQTKSYIFSTICVNFFEMSKHKYRNIYM